MVDRIGISYSLARCPQCGQKYAAIPLGEFSFLLWKSKGMVGGEETAAPMWAVRVQPQGTVAGMLTLQALQALVQIASPACPVCNRGDVKASVAEVEEPDWLNIAWDSLDFTDRETVSLEILTLHAAPVEKGWLHLPPPPIPFCWGV